MRARLITAGVLGGLLAAGLGSATALAADKVPGSIRSKVTQLVERLVGGDVDPTDSQARETIFNKLDTELEKDKKGIALRTPSFWVETITTSYFTGKARKSATHKKVTSETMQVGPFPADGSFGEVEIVFWGASAYTPKEPHPLLLCIAPDGEDLKGYLESKWLVDENLKKGWIVAAVAESDKYPIGKHAWMASHAFVHMRTRFNVDPNRFFLAAEGPKCETVQRIAATAIPDRVAGLVLLSPEKPVTSQSSSLYAAAVVHAGDDDATAKAYLELDAEKSKSIAAGDTALAEVVAWLEGHPGRVLPASYTWETGTTEEGTTLPWTGSMWIESPQKRGDPVVVQVTYEKETNSVKLKADNLGGFRIYMNDDLLNLDEPVSIVVNDEVLVTKRFERRVRTMFSIADDFGEYGRVFTADFRGIAPTPVEPAGDDGDKKDGAE